MYPILIPLADRGLLDTRWETEHVAGRPARHMYRLSANGREYATASIHAAQTTVPASTAHRSQPRLQGA